MFGSRPSYKQPSARWMNSLCRHLATSGIHFTPRTLPPAAHTVAEACWRGGCDALWASSAVYAVVVMDRQIAGAWHIIRDLNSSK